MMDGSRAAMLATALLIPMVGFFMAAMPYLMRRDEVFAVTVPQTAQRDPYLKGLKRHYALVISLVTAVLTLAAFGFTLTGNGGGTMAVLIAGTLVLCIGGYLLMLAHRAQVISYKREQGWAAETQESVAAVGGESAPQALPLTWNLLYLPIILVTVIIGIVGYSSMPDMIPLHADFAGNVDRWEPKGAFVIGFPVAMQLFLAACFVFSHWVILRSKKWSEPGAPVTSALAYGMFARAQSMFILISGLAVTTVLGVSFMLAALGELSLGQAGVFVVAVAVLVLAGSIVLGAVYGQAGSRVFRRMRSSDVLLADDDEHWKGGVFYCNAEDPSLFLPKRFGVGWTVNCARPAVWAILVGGVALTVAFVVGVTWLA